MKRKQFIYVAIDRNSMIGLVKSKQTVTFLLIDCKSTYLPDDKHNLKLATLKWLLSRRISPMRGCGPWEGLRERA